MELFSDAWAIAWREAINGNATYREVGANWDGPVVLRRSEDADTGVFVTLSGGVCHDARRATRDDEAEALIVIEAPEATWRRMLAGDIDPVRGLLKGDLTLAKGSLFTLMPHQASARALLESATWVDTAAPQDDTGRLVEDEG